jgi:hypothetical protein
VIAGFASALPGVAGIALVLAVTAILGLLAEWYWENL